MVLRSRFRNSCFTRFYVGVPFSLRTAESTCLPLFKGTELACLPCSCGSFKQGSDVMSSVKPPSRVPRWPQAIESRQITPNTKLSLCSDSSTVPPTSMQNRRVREKDTTRFRRKVHTSAAVAVASDTRLPRPLSSRPRPLTTNETGLIAAVAAPVLRRPGAAPLRPVPPRCRPRPRRLAGAARYAGRVRA